jgi:hypothetical protein
MRRWWVRAVVVLVPAGLLLGIGGWCLVDGYRVSRERVAVDRIWFRMENAYRHRMELVPDFLKTAGGDRGRAADFMDRFRAAAEALSGFASSPALLEDTGRFEEFCRAQDEVAACASGLLDMSRDAGEGTLQVLRAQLQDTQERLRTERRALSEAVERYNGSLGRFPGKLVGSLFGWRPVLPAYSREPVQTRAAGSGGDEGGSL